MLFARGVLLALAGLSFLLIVTLIFVVQRWGAKARVCVQSERTSGSVIIGVLSMAEAQQAKQAIEEAIRPHRLGSSLR